MKRSASGVEGVLLICQAEGFPVRALYAHCIACIHCLILNYPVLFPELEIFVGLRNKLRNVTKDYHKTKKKTTLL